MAGSAFSVIEKYQALDVQPVRAGGELKVIEAGQAVRAVNGNATLIFYYAIDYARTWYDLGRYFDEHEALEVHNADGWRANHTDSDGGAPNLWGIFDWSVAAARDAWVDRIASVVSTADVHGKNLFDGVFIDGYRGAGSWASGLIPNATQVEQVAWEAGAAQLGPALAAALGNETIRFINPGQLYAQWPGYSANSIEFFAPTDSDIAFLQSIIGAFPTIEVHAYIGANVDLFNRTLAAYLIGVGEGAYFGAGASWAQCDDWLIPHFEYAESLGAPDGPGVQAGGVWSRSFAGGATTVTLDTGGARAACAPETMGAWTIANTAQYFALVSANASLREYRLFCNSSCSTSWHTASASSPAPFTGFHIKYDMQPGFAPVEDNGVFDQSCSVIQYGASASGDWCAKAANPSCQAQAAQKSCIRWASGRTTGNSC